MFKSRAVTFALSIYALVGVSTTISPAIAQTVGNSSQPEPQLQEVVITGRKRTENVQDVPTAVTVVNAETLREDRAFNALDLGYGVTGLFMDSATGGSSAVNVSLRGVSGNAELTGVRSGVGFFVDGASVFNQTAFNLPLLDVERVEVLKGPQPAAFGRSVIGGAINIVSAMPPDTLSMTGDLSYGNYNSKQAWATVGGPLSDDLRVSVSGLILSHDGYLTNLTEKGLDADSADVTMAKLNVFYKPFDKLSFQFITDYYQNLGFTGPAQCNVVAYGCPSNPLTDRVVKSLNGPYRDTSVKNISSRLISNYNFDSGFKFVSLTAYRFNRAFQNFDIFDAGGGTEFSNYKDAGSWEGSQELRLVSPDTNSLTYLFGVLFDHEHLDFHIPFIVPRDVPVPEFPQLCCDLILDDGMLKPTNVASAFVSGSDKLTDHWSADVGLRLTHESTTATSSQSVVESAGLTDQQAANTYYGISLFDITRSQSWNNFEWQGALSYKFSPDAMVYGRISQGKKSGGFTQLIIFNNSTITNPAFGPETLTTYELGTKGDILEGKVHWDADVFYNDYKDIQARFQTTDNFGIRLIYNVGAATSYGTEFATTVAITQHVSLVTGVTYQPSQFTKAVPEIGILKGNEFEFLPRWLGNIALNAQYPIAAHTQWFGLVNGGARSLSYLDDQNDATQSSSVILNARTGIAFDDGKLNVALWGKNLTNKYVVTFQYTNFSLAGVPAPQYVPNDPRTFGIEVSYKL